LAFSEQPIQEISQLLGRSQAGSLLLCITHGFDPPANGRFRRTYAAIVLSAQLSDGQGIRIADDYFVDVASPYYPPAVG
jgi:hypothetical protein